MPNVKVSTCPATANAPIIIKAYVSRVVRIKSSHHHKKIQLGGGAPLSFILPRHRTMFLPRTSNYWPGPFRFGSFFVETASMVRMSGWSQPFGYKNGWRLQRRFTLMPNQRSAAFCAVPPRYIFPAVWHIIFVRRTCAIGPRARRAIIVLGKCNAVAFLTGSFFWLGHDQSLIFDGIRNRHRSIAARCKCPRRYQGAGHMIQCRIGLPHTPFFMRFAPRSQWVPSRHSPAKG